MSGLPALNLELVQRARELLRPYDLRTPLLESKVLGELAGRRVYLKAENLQRTGSFKVRGALARMAALEGEARHRGAVAASAGNHGLGVAFASRSLGIPALVVVPETVAKNKLAALRQMMVKVRVFGGCYDEAERHAIELAAEADATFVSPYDDPWVRAGNGGTVGLEIREQLPDVGGVVAPLGGGGLASGLAVALGDAVPVLGVNSEASPAMARSLAEGRVYDYWKPAPTLAEGLEGGVSATSVELCGRLLAGVSVVREASIAEAIRFMVQTHKIVLEGSAAVSVAMLLEAVEAVAPDPALGGAERADVRFLPGEGPLCLVLTGRNIDQQRLKAILWG